MAGRKNSRTSKTDHVLSLLAGAGTDREETSPAPAAGEETAPARKAETPQAASSGAPERHLAPPILEVARLHNETLSETIREALTENLEQELAAQPSKPEAEPQPAAESAPQPEADPQPQPESQAAPQPPSEPEPEPEPQLQAEPKPEPHSQPVPSPAPVGPGTVLEDGSVYVNVMEELVGEPIEKYVKMFGLCTCQRCLSDVRALTLSRLPAKYVVLSGNTLVPMMSFYQAKFESAIIAQVIQACKAVMEQPRHTL